MQAMGQAERPTCPKCGANMTLVLPSGVNGRTLQCESCERGDPLKSGKASGWIKGELRPPK
jgi:hypothetical protein